MPGDDCVSFGTGTLLALGSREVYLITATGDSDVELIHGASRPMGQPTGPQDCLGSSE